MRILITTDAFTPMVNGVTVSVETLYKKLTERGHEVKIVALSQDTSSKRVKDIYYVRSFKLYIYPGVRGSIAYNKRFLKELYHFSPDIVHSQTEFFTFAYARKMVQMLGIPWVHTYHTLYEDYTGYLKLNKYIGRQSVKVFTRERLKKCDVVIAVTEKVKQVLRGYGMQNDIRIIPTGVDLSRFGAPMSEEEKRALRAQYGIQPDAPLLITVGRLGAEKNMEETIDNFALLHEKNRDIRLMIVGDGPHREALRQHVADRGVTDSVIFTGMVPPEVIPRYYRTADIFVNASTSETQGLTYLEALASGTPVICRDDPCVTDLVKPGENGFLYTTREGYLTAMETLLGSSETRHAFEQAAVLSAEEHSDNRFVDRMESLYEGLIRRR